MSRGPMTGSPAAQAVRASARRKTRGTNATILRRLERIFSAFSRGRTHPLRRTLDTHSPALRDAPRDASAPGLAGWAHRRESLFRPACMGALPAFLLSGRVRPRNRHVGDGAAQGVRELNPALLERRSHRSVHLDQGLGITRLGLQLGQLSPEQIALAQDQLIGRGDAGIEPLLLAFETLLGKGHGLAGGFDPGLPLYQSNRGLSHFERDLVARTLQADLQLVSLELRAQVVGLRGTIPKRHV